MSSGGAGGDQKKVTSEKQTASNILTIAVVIVILAIVRNVYRARKDGNKFLHHHRQWLPLSADEMKVWQFEPLQTAAAAAAEESAAKTATVTGGDVSTNSKTAQKIATPSKPEKDPGVQRGWKIVCEKVPCQELLPGELGTGGIVSIDGVFNSCFDLLLGDDNLGKNDEAAEKLLIAVRSTGYIVVNSYDGGWGGETVHRGTNVFIMNEPFKLDLKFLKAFGDAVQVK
ncbi:hypothetical protein AAMO2058_000869600 [Amorphochlora amoebiformis]